MDHGIIIKSTPTSHQKALSRLRGELRNFRPFPPHEEIVLVYYCLRKTGGFFSNVYVVRGEMQ